MRVAIFESLKFRSALLRLFGAVSSALNIGLLVELYPNLNRWWMIGAELCAVTGMVIGVTTAVPRLGKGLLQAAVAANLGTLTLLAVDPHLLGNSLLAILLAVGGAAAGAICVTGFLDGRKRPLDQKVFLGLGCLVISILAVALADFRTLDLWISLLDVSVAALVIAFVVLMVWNKLRPSPP